MFQLLIVKPLFNLLVVIYTLLPGHNFGLSLIIFTIIIRFLMWPLVRKQLHHAQAMRKLQPELKRIKQATKGDKQKESTMVMELYKEREINPFGSIGILVVQLIILIGLYSGLRKVVSHPQAVVEFSYPWVQHMAWLKTVAGDISKFDNTLLGFVDLTKAALPKTGGIYWPAMFIVFGSAIAQYFQSKQLTPDDKDARSLRKILREASHGQQADQAEINAAIGRSTRYFIPVMIFLFTVNLPSALGLYWLTGGVVAYLQQAHILKRGETELETVADKKSSKKGRKIIEGEVVQKSKTKPATKPKKPSAKKPTKKGRK
jgi:YidC/Oxa1 family membrane protein insertase